MQMENHKEEVPFSHYCKLFRELDPQDALRRLDSVTFDGAAFTLELLGTQYTISWPEFAIASASPKAMALNSLPAQTYLMRYLLEAKELPSLGQQLTFREMPWGELYIQPFTGRCLARAAFTFGTRVEAFRAACEKLGAEKVNHGDAGYRFHIIGPYYMDILVWAGDDEFPPSAQLLYSDNFAEGFAAEDRVVSGDLLITTVKLAM